MDEPPKPPLTRPDLTPAAQAARAARLEREAAALRDNLRRRKQMPVSKPAAPEPPPCR